MKVTPVEGQRIIIPLKDQIAEVGRELGMRKGVYKKWVANGTFTQEESDRRIALMDAVYRTLKWLEANRAEIVAGAALAETITDQPAKETKP